MEEKDNKNNSKAPVSYTIPAGAVPDPINLKRAHFEYLNSGVDLVLRVTISLQEALFGFRLGFRHLDDHVILVESPAFEVLGDESILIVENEGMPFENSSREHGDLLIAVTVAMPTSQDIRTMSPEHVAQLKSILPPRVHDDGTTDALVGKHFKSARNNEEYEVQIVRTAVYDKEAHMSKRRNDQQRSSHDAEDEDEDAGHGPSGQPGCKQM